MLNQAFPKFMKTDGNKNYILDKKIQDIIISQNKYTNTGLEERLDDIYSDELKIKLNDLGIDIDFFKDKTIMDICSGAGFLTYHLIKLGIQPKKIILCDISAKEIKQSKLLLEKINRGNIYIKYINSNVLENDLKSEYFDIIIGNSFLHHFYDIPNFLKSIYRILKNDGIFISTHEPSTKAIAIESGCFALYIYSLIRGIKYIDDIRRKGETIKSNNLGDIRVFDNNNLKKVFRDVKFKNINIKNYNIFKSLLMTNFGLSPIRIPILPKWKLKIMRMGIIIDNFLKRILPNHWFGAIIFKIQK